MTVTLRAPQGGAAQVRKCVESGIEFDFSSATEVHEHDRTVPNCSGNTSADGNNAWPGVDFRIRDDDGWIWLEVKHWPRGPGRFAGKMKSKAFALEVRDKFLGTTAHLAWRGQFTAVNVRYILLFQPPPTADPALLTPFADLIRRALPVAHVQAVRLALMSLDEWTQRFEAYPARRGSVTPPASVE